MVFGADDLGAWLIALLADAGRRRLTALVLGTDLERALSSAAGTAIERTAQGICPADREKAEILALVIGQVFRSPEQAGSPGGGETMLELLRAGVARQLAVLGDAELTGAGFSSAEVLGVRADMLTKVLTGNLLSAIMVGGARGGPLFPLANQLNHDLTHLQLRENRAAVPDDTGQPLYVTASVKSTIYRSDDCIVDVPLDQLERWSDSGLPSSGEDPRTWGFRNHLESADKNCLHLTVEGLTDQAVILNRIQVHVLRRLAGSIPRGVRLDLSGLALGSSLKARSFAVDLRSTDVAVPVPMPLDPYDPDLTPDFPYTVRGYRSTPQFPYVVYRTEPERFSVSLDYGDEDIEWFAVLDWQSAGRSGSVRIDDAGAPFLSTAYRSRPVHYWLHKRRGHLCADEACYRTHHRSRI